VTGAEVFSFIMISTHRLILAALLIASLLHGGIGIGA
jgi:hypothetical protein